jgi:hypothetical protein
MRFAKRLLMVAGAVALAGLFSVMLAPKAVHAVVAALVQIEPGTTTHLGQNESQLVSLICYIGTTNCNELDAMGNVSSSSYVVPAGYTLVVTDYEWNIPSAGSSGSFSCDYLLDLSNKNALLGGTCAIAGTSGFVYGAGHFTSGIRLASGQTVYDSNASNEIGGAFIQGYLVPN